MVCAVLIGFITFFVYYLYYLKTVALELSYPSVSGRSEAISYREGVKKKKDVVNLSFQR